MNEIEEERVSQVATLQKEILETFEDQAQIIFEMIRENKRLKEEVDALKVQLST